MVAAVWHGREFEEHPIGFGDLENQTMPFIQAIEEYPGRCDVPADVDTGLSSTGRAPAPHRRPRVFDALGLVPADSKYPPGKAEGAPVVR